LKQCRRWSKDYEEWPTTSETFVSVAMTRLMLKRLAAKNAQAAPLLAAGGNE